MPDSAPQIGFLVKKAQNTLHGAMEDALRPLGLTVSQYACLHQLAVNPGISASQLARNTFVTRQSMNSLVQGILGRALVVRPDRAATGRALPTELTAAGARLLAEAELVVDAVEARMLRGLSTEAQHALGQALADCITALEGTD